MIFRPELCAHKGYLAVLDWGPCGGEGIRWLEFIFGVKSMTNNPLMMAILVYLTIAWAIGSWLPWEPYFMIGCWVTAISLCVFDLLKKD